MTDTIINAMLAAAVGWVVGMGILIINNQPDPRVTQVYCDAMLQKGDQGVQLSVGEMQYLIDNCAEMVNKRVQAR